MADFDVSVLTPSFGYARYLPDALSSVEGQEGISVQHVIQDGGSTDGTVELLQKAGSHVDWRSEPDTGQSDALNRALERATGRWVSWLNADEFYLPGALAHLVGIAERADAGLAYGDALFVDAAGKVQRLLAQHRYDRTTLWHYGTIIPSCAVLIRREALGSQPWDGALRLLMDRALYMRLVSEGASVEYTKRPIGAFRVHDARVSAASSQTFEGDYAGLAERHGRTSKPMKVWATTKHRMLKLTGGSYSRQRRVAALAGLDTRWFAGDEGIRGCRAVFDAYGSGTEPAMTES